MKNAPSLVSFASINNVRFVLASFLVAQDAASFSFRAVFTNRRSVTTPAVNTAFYNAFYNYLGRLVGSVGMYIFAYIFLPRRKDSEIH